MNSKRLHTLLAGWPARVAALGALLWLAGCGTQASTEYEGEPLLSMSGSVEFALERDDEAELKPALAFRSQEDEFFVLDVVVDGEFPAGFTLDVYEPPPSEAFINPSEYLDDEPMLALAYITAVTPDHPEVLRYGTETGSSMSSCAADADCESITEMSWCASNADECYVETTVCPSPAAPPGDCVTTSEGDPALKTQPFEHFAGLSENYLVIYLREPAAPRSYTAALLGARDDGLARGYHLLSMEPGSDERADEVGDCQDAAGEIALQQYNAEHGTSFTTYQLESDECGEDPMRCDAETNVCGPLYLPCPESLHREWHARRDRVRVERGCPMTEVVITPIADPASERVSVRIGPNVEPLSS